MLPSESPPLPLTEVQTALALLVRRAVVENELVLLITSGIRNELAEEFAKGKEMCLDIQERKKVTCNQEA